MKEMQVWHRYGDTWGCDEEIPEFDVELNLGWKEAKHRIAVHLQLEANILIIGNGPEIIDTMTEFGRVWPDKRVTVEIGYDTITRRTLFTLYQLPIIKGIVTDFVAALSCNSIVYDPQSRVSTVPSCLLRSVKPSKVITQYNLYALLTMANGLTPTSFDDFLKGVFNGT